MRITLSEQPWSPKLTSTADDAIGYGGSGPAKGYWIEETEDYYFVPTIRRVERADLDCNNRVDMTDLSIFASQWLDESQ